MRQVSTPEIRRIAATWAVWSGSVLFAASLVASWARPVRDPWPREFAVHAPPLARWDSGWYYGIAEHGYSVEPGTGQNNVAFYPLYPLLCRWLGRLLPAPTFDVGIGLSLFCLLGALLLFGDLCAGWAESTGAYGSILTLLLYPSAFFFAAFYTESLFLLATTAAFWTARERRWLLCGLAGAAACLTRFNGFLIAVPITWYAWESTDRRLRNLGWRPVAAIAMTAAGAAAFPVYLWRRFGDPLLYLHRRTAGWELAPKPFWVVLWNAILETTRSSLSPS
jgi:hypothetical protein